MPKFYVRIYGKVPDELVVEARTHVEAEEMALLEIAERLECKASLIEEQPVGGK